MDILATNELSQLKASITVLSKTGKYGEAVRKINAMDLKAKAYLSSSDWEGFINGWICCNVGDYCCDNCGDNWCCWGYCCGFLVLINCCGSEVAGTFCGCDWLIDECCDKCCF